MSRRNRYDRKADAIITADLHLRDTTPECRVDDFLTARNRKVAWLRDLQKEHGGCPIIDAGDVFHRWQVSSELEGWALLNLPDNIITVPGNHDLPNHSLKLYKKSSLHVLEAAHKVIVIKEGYTWDSTVYRFLIHGIPFGDEIIPLDKKAIKPQDDSQARKIVVVHAYVGETVPPYVDGYTPQQLLAALPGYDLIVSGHNHTPLVYGVKDRRGRQRLVVNPGSMMRMFADQADMRPRCYLWFAEENEALPEYYPIEKGVVSREHIERVEERDARMEAFVARLDNSGVEAGLSFERNVKQYLVKNKIKAETRKMVEEAVNGN